jgi:hypothetical protein
MFPFGSLVGAAVLQSCNASFSPSTAALGIAFGFGEVAAIVLFAVAFAMPPPRTASVIALRGTGLAVTF